MRCYQHGDGEAVGCCRSCGRGVCRTCAREGEEGLTCSDRCQELARANHQMTLRALKIYGIGERPRRITPVVVAWILPGAVFAGFAAFSSWRAGRIDAADAFALTLGTVMLVGGLWMYAQGQRINAPS